MRLLNKLFRGSEDINKRYKQIQDKNVAKGFEQARERNIDVNTEPFHIEKMVPLPGAVNGEHYWIVADFILAEYPIELGFQVASAFHHMASQRGFDPFGKIMVGMQYTDRKAGSPIMTRFSFAKEHPDFFQYITEKDYAERTEKALTFLATAVFQFSGADYAKKIFPTLLIVPEMKKGVKERIYSIDEVVAEYVTK